MPITYVNIASTTLGSNQASVTFSSIPQTYTDLVLQYSARQTGTSDVQDTITVGVNGSPSGTLFSATRLRGNGSTALSNRLTNHSNYNLEQGATAGGNVANIFASGELYIPNYTAAHNKPASAFTAHEDNAALAYMRGVALLWRSTSAITSLVLNIESGQNFASGSSFFLYGVKNS